MSKREYDLCTDAVVYTINKYYKNWGPEDIIKYLTLSVGYTATRQQIILKSLGTKIKIEDIQEKIQKYISDYYQNLKSRAN